MFVYTDQHGSHRIAAISLCCMLPLLRGPGCDARTSYRRGMMISELATFLSLC